jgi:hypothetical protein
VSTQVESRQAHSNVYFPLGHTTAQVLRIVADETLLLNSREKAPFMLLIEVRAAGAVSRPPSVLVAPSWYITSFCPRMQVVTVDASSRHCPLLHSELAKPCTPSVAATPLVADAHKVVAMTPHYVA